MKLFNFNNDTVSTETPEPSKKKVRGKPFTGRGDPRNNLSGRPKLGRTLAERYRNALAEAEGEAKGGNYTKLDAMIDVLIEKALDGDQRAIEYLQERGWGKVPDRLELAKIEPEHAEYDFTRLTLDERKTLMDLLEKATPDENKPEKPSEKTPSLPSYIDGEVVKNDPSGIKDDHQ